jgi:hypothetical protein
MTNNYKDVISKPEISFWIPLLIPLLALAIAWGTITSEIKAQKEELTTIKQTVAEYPSKDYFELKFKTIDTNILVLGGKLDKHLGQ